MLGRQFAALGEAAAGEDVAMRRSHVAFVRTVLSYAVEEGFHREDVLVFGQLEYDHPVSYEVAVAKKPRMILNSEVMGDEQPVPP